VAEAPSHYLSLQPARGVNIDPFLPGIVRAPLQDAAAEASVSSASCGTMPRHRLGESVSCVLTVCCCYRGCGHAEAAERRQVVQLLAVALDVEVAATDGPLFIDDDEWDSFEEMFYLGGEVQGRTSPVRVCLDPS